MSSPRVLVAGVGNVFLGDDGFGVEVAQRLARESWPEGVRVADFGIRGVHLAYELLDGVDTFVLVDAMTRGFTPGTVFVLEPDIDAIGDEDALEGHSLHPAAVLRMARGLGATLPCVRIVGCEPAEIAPQMGLSEQVEGAITEASRIVRRLVGDAVAQRNTTAMEAS